MNKEVLDLWPELEWIHDEQLREATAKTWELALERPELTQIDVGACWDAYCGVLNRHGYKRDTWKDAMQRNLAP